jgi:hypothetical protein
MQSVDIEKFTKSEFASYFSEVNLNTIVQEIVNGNATIVELEPYFKVLLQLSNNGQRLSWEKIKHIALHAPRNVDPPRLIEQGYGDLQKEMLGSIIDYFDLGNNQGILFDDHAADCAVRLNCEVILKIVTDFITTPGHKYFLSIEGQFLLNFTMENSVFFTEKLNLTMPSGVF